MINGDRNGINTDRENTDKTVFFPIRVNALSFEAMFASLIGFIYGTERKFTSA